MSEFIEGTTRASQLDDLLSEVRRIESGDALPLDGPFSAKPKVSTKPNSFTLAGFRFLV